MLGDMPDAETPPASIGSVVMFAGSLEATEALKLIVGRDDDSRGAFRSYDLSCGRVASIAFERDPDCPVCGRRRSEIDARSTPPDGSRCREGPDGQVDNEGRMSRRR